MKSKGLIKRSVCLVMMLALVLTSTMVSAFAVATDFVTAKTLNSNIVGCPTVVAKISSVNEIGDVVKEGIATSAMIEIASLNEAKAVIAEAKGKIRTIFVLNDRAVAREIANYVAAQNLSDIHIASTNDTLIKEFRTIATKSIGSLIVEADTLTIQDGYDLVKRSNNCWTKNIILDVKAADKAVIEKIQQRITTVWVMSDDTAVGANKSITSGATGVICSDLALLKKVSDTYTTRTLTRRLFTVAHRGTGTNSLAPENTMAAYRWAVDDYGADTVECDIYLTKDGGVINLHDTTFNRTTDIGTTTAITEAEFAAIFANDPAYFPSTNTLAQNKAKIRPRDLTTEQALRLDAGSKLGGAAYAGEPIHTLEELLRYCVDKDVLLFCEAKDEAGVNQPVDYNGCEAAAIKIVEELSKEPGYESVSDYIAIISFNDQTASLPRYSLLSPWMSLGYLNTPADATNSNIPTRLEGIMGTIQRFNASYNTTTGAVNEVTARELIARGISMWPWTYSSSSATQRQHFDFGITGATTNVASWTSNSVMSIYPTSYRFSTEKGSDVDLTYTTLTNLKDDLQLPAEVVIIEGKENISVAGTTVTGINDGTAVVMLKTQSPATDGNDSYTLYSQPITITVGDVVDINLSGNKAVTVDGEAEYTVSAGNIKKLATATVWFEVDSDYFSGKDVEGLGGFDVLNGITWESKSGSLWSGRVTLVNYDGGVTSAESLDILKLTLNVKEKLGATKVKITRVELSGYDAYNTAVFFASDLQASTVSTQVVQEFSPYDVNRDGKVDQLDLTTAQLYYKAAEGDDNWAEAKCADVNGDGKVNIADLILILNNIVW